MATGSTLMTENHNKAAADIQKPSRRTSQWAVPLTLAFAAAVGVGAIVVAREVKYSAIQAWFFSKLAKGDFSQYTKTVKELPAAVSPSDKDLGYAYIANKENRKKLQQEGNVLSDVIPRQEYTLPLLGTLYPIFERPVQTGLTINDEAGNSLYKATYPNKIYKDFDAVPPLLANSLAYVEDREVIAPGHPETWNPAINLPRLVKAGWDRLLTGHSSGGSTLVIQTIKNEFSAGAKTKNPHDKALQIAGASMDIYKDGPDTSKDGPRIITDYLNKVDLAAHAGFGEIHGFPDAVEILFGTEFDEFNRLLKQPQNNLTDAQMKPIAKAYRQALTLIMAVQMPAKVLQTEKGFNAAQKRVDIFLPALVQDGIISSRFADMVRAEQLFFVDLGKHPIRSGKKESEKYKNALRVDLMQKLGLPAQNGLYDLDRFDMTAKTTIDAKINEAVTKRLHSFNDPEVAKAMGLTGFQLLRPERAAEVVWAITIHEMRNGVPLERVRTDNSPNPLDETKGGLQELGSTSKLRTLATYLQIVEEMHKKYAGQSPANLNEIDTNPKDHLTRWALDYLSDPKTDKSLNAMLDASLERKYSGSPNESFFTAGGLQSFENFDSKENTWNRSVRENFANSVNLAFIRITRDILYYTIYQDMNLDPSLFNDVENSMREDYLKQFADNEGKDFLYKFWKEQKDKTPAEIAALLAAKTRGTPSKLAVIYRSIFPDAPREKFDDFVRANCKNCELADKKLGELYDAYAPGKFNLNDRGYLARPVHPLALELGAYRATLPADAKWEKADWQAAVEATKDARVEVYQWLTNPKNSARLKSGQDNRIWTTVEKEAFTHIHKRWKELGYGRDRLVPSLATGVMGVSGDTTKSLTELMEIVLNNGLRGKTINFTDITFGKGTPYETRVTPAPVEPVRVMSAEVASRLREELQYVVQNGTGIRLRKGITLADGTPVSFGGKTGTGDGRSDGKDRAEGQQRTGTFVGMINDDFAVTITARLPNPSSADKFTSGLAVQALKILAEYDLKPLLERHHAWELAQKKAIPAPRIATPAVVEQVPPQQAPLPAPIVVQEEEAPAAKPAFESAAGNALPKPASAPEPSTTEPEPAEPEKEAPAPVPPVSALPFRLYGYV
ncbi:MAG TPA: transglycosylase domain-containing protein [Micavibrio sp.]